VGGARGDPLANWLEGRPDHTGRLLKERARLVADRFTVADPLMAEAPRVAKIRALGGRPSTESCVTRIAERPSSRMARADQPAHFAAADGPPM